MTRFTSARAFALGYIAVGLAIALTANVAAIVAWNVSVALVCGPKVVAAARPFAGPFLASEWRAWSACISGRWESARRRPLVSKVALDPANQREVNGDFVRRLITASRLINPASIVRGLPRRRPPGGTIAGAHPGTPPKCIEGDDSPEGRPTGGTL